MIEFPHIIHQIWLQGVKNLPENYKLNIEQNRKLHPKWEYIIWDDLSIIKLLRNKQEWIDAFYKLEYLHHKVDFARYVILYLYGGAYIDIDASTIKPLDPLLIEYNNYDLIVSKINSNIMENYLNCQHKECINNGIIITKPGNIEMKNLIDSIVNNPKCATLSTKISCIRDITGPTKFTSVMTTSSNANKIKILESEYLEPCTFDKCDITNNTYVVHKHGGSWYPGWFRDLMVFYVNNKTWIYIIIIIIIIILMYRYIV